MSGSAKRWTDGKTETRWNDRDDAMTDTETTVFREKTLKKASDPEQLDGYLKVTGFGPWFVILAAALVLAAIFIWVFFGKIQTAVTGAGYCENGTIRCYFAQNAIGEIPEGSTVDIQGSPGTVTEIESSLYRAVDIPDDVLFLLPDARWYSTAQIRCDLEDGLYSVVYPGTAIAPASFLTQGD